MYLNILDTFSFDNFLLDPFLLYFKQKVEKKPQFRCYYLLLFKMSEKMVAFILFPPPKTALTSKFKFNVFKKRSVKT